jgi:hypothetical protein
MRPLTLVAVPLALAVGSLAPTARASPPDPPDAALALVSGAAVNVAGMIVGGTVMATSHGAILPYNAGWMTMEASFTVSPLLAHGLVGEWGRGLAFAAGPAAMLGGTAALFQMAPDTVEHGTLPQQRVMWALFGIGFLASAAGVVDATLAPRRARAIRDVVIAPVVGAGQMGLQIGGRL